MNLLTQGLNVQAMQVKANAQQLTNADLQNINDAGLQLVHKPDVRSNVVSIEMHRLMNAYTSPEAA